MTDNPNASAWKDPAIWGRAVFALLYMLILSLVVGPLAIMLGLAQGVFTVATGEDNRNLRDLGAALASYVHEILLFATWNRERKPFPFSEFPRADSDAAGESAEPVGDEAAETQAGETVVAEDGGESDAAGAGSQDGTSGETAEAKAPARKGARKKETGSRKAAGDDSPGGD